MEYRVNSLIILPKKKQDTVIAFDLFTNHSQALSQSSFPDFFLYLEAFESNLTSDWLNHIV